MYGSVIKKGNKCFVHRGLFLTGCNLPQPEKDEQLHYSMLSCLLIRLMQPVLSWDIACQVDRPDPVPHMN